MGEEKSYLGRVKDYIKTEMKKAARAAEKGLDYLLPSLTSEQQRRIDEAKTEEERLLLVKKYYNIFEMPPIG